MFPFTALSSCDLPHHITAKTISAMPSRHESALIAPRHFRFMPKYLFLLTHSSIIKRVQISRTPHSRPPHPHHYHNMSMARAPRSGHDHSSRTAKDSSLAGKVHLLEDPKCGTANEIKISTVALPYPNAPNVPAANSPPSARLSPQSWYTVLWYGPHDILGRTQERHALGSSALNRTLRRCRKP